MRDSDSWCDETRYEHKRLRRCINSREGSTVVEASLRRMAGKKRQQKLAEAYGKTVFIHSGRFRDRQHTQSFVVDVLKIEKRRRRIYQNYRALLVAGARHSDLLLQIPNRVSCFSMGPRMRSLSFFFLFPNRSGAYYVDVAALALALALACSVERPPAFGGVGLPYPRV